MHCLACEQPLPDGAEFCSRCGARRLDPTPDPLIGTTVGDRYRITRIIGEGGMGAVYEAEQRMGSTFRKVAVKVLLPELSREATLRRRFVAECAIVARLEHPNTVDVYDFGETDGGQLYIVMEYVRGESLDAMAPLPVDRTLHVVEQICGALEEAHGEGIVHRDLKPDNVFLTRRAGQEDFVKLLDFGIALETGSSRHKTRLTADGTVLGTPPYMSPEQLSDQPLDARSDIYSLGVIVYELLTGRLPFAASGPWEWAQRHLYDEPLSFDATEAGRRVPGAVREAVLAALAKQPDDRPATAREFAERLTRDSAMPLALRRDTSERTAPFLAPPPAAVPSPGPIRTEAAVAAPPRPSRARPGSRVAIAVVVPLLALLVSATMVGAAWVTTLDTEAPELPTAPAAPPHTVVHPDVSPTSASASVTATETRTATATKPALDDPGEGEGAPPRAVPAPRPPVTSTRPSRSTEDDDEPKRPPRPRRPSR